MLLFNRCKHISINSISICYKRNINIRKTIDHQQLRTLLINKYSNFKRFILTGIRFNSYYGPPGTWESTMFELRNSIRRKVLLIKGSMIKKRNILINVPFSIASFNWSYTFSDLCGHGAFLMLGFSYLETEIFNLRLYAASGITLSIIFQYYREKPLWIPIRWNTMFLLINAIMIAHILKEQYDVQNIPNEQMQIYDTVFKVRGMKPVDFLHLMSIAHRHELKKGEKLIMKGTKHHYVHLLQHGRLSVNANNNEKLSDIKENQFAGAISFVKWQANPETRKKIKKKIEYHNYHLYNGTTEEFGHFLQNISIWTSSFDDDMAYDTEEIAIVMKSKVASNNKTKLVDSIKYNSDNEGDGELGQADVTAEEDCVIFSWDFIELDELLATQTSLGVVFELCISADVNSKMVSMMNTTSSNIQKNTLNHETK